METTTASIPTRPLGPSGLTVSALGIGTWALGGPFTFDGRDAGWGEVDDDVSIRALHSAIDAGVTLIDTAPTYSTGHSERIVGRAVAALFATMAQRMGREMATLLPLRGYTLNIFGSLAGVAAFAVISWLQLSPVWWFALAFASAVPLLFWPEPSPDATAAIPRPALTRARPSAIGVAINLGLLIVGLVVVQLMARGAIWSPYYKIGTEIIDVATFATPRPSRYARSDDGAIEIYLSIPILSRSSITAHDIPSINPPTSTYTALPTYA